MYNRLLFVAEYINFKKCLFIEYIERNIYFRSHSKHYLPITKIGQATFGFEAQVSVEENELVFLLSSFENLCSEFENMEINLHSLSRERILT